AHIHAAFAGRILLNVNLDDLATRDAYLERIATFAGEHHELPWIVGGGWYNPIFLETDGPRAADLDAVVADRPVFLMNADTHAAWVNTRALEAGAITSATPDPWDGYYVRDADGMPTGCLQEGAAYSFWSDVVPRATVEGWVHAIHTGQQRLHALGITGWQDAWVEPDLLRAYRSLDDAGVQLVALGVRGLQHAMGVRAVGSALVALETSRSTNGANVLRHHIAHLNLPEPEDVWWVREVGAVVNMQPFWAQPIPLIETM